MTYKDFLEGYKQKRLEEIDKLWAYVNGVLENSYNQELVHAFQKGVSSHFLNRKLQSKGIGFIIRLNRLLMQITP